MVAGQSGKTNCGAETRGGERDSRGCAGRATIFEMSPGQPAIPDENREEAAALAATTADSVGDRHAPRNTTSLFTWTLLVSGGCLLGIYVCMTLAVDRLCTPESARLGLNRMNAHVLSRALFGASLFPLIGMTVWNLHTRGRRRWFFIPLVAIACDIAMVRYFDTRIEQTPALRSALRESVGELEAVAEDVANGRAVSWPKQTGRFELIAGERLTDGSVALYTKARRGVFEEYWGFVRIQDDSADEGPATLAGFGGEIGNRHRIERLEGKWFVLFETYWFVKRGWS